MKFFIDCEFNSFQGELISMALVSEHGKELCMVNYDVFENPAAHGLPPSWRGKEPLHPWVKANVLPYLFTNIPPVKILPKSKFKQSISNFVSRLAMDDDVVFIADWHTDIEHLCNVLVGDGGSTVTLNRSLVYSFIVDRNIDSYADPLPGSVEHNALHDARNIKRAYEAKYGR